MRVLMARIIHRHGSKRTDAHTLREGCWVCRFHGVSTGHWLNVLFGTGPPHVEGPVSPADACPAASAPLALQLDGVCSSLEGLGLSHQRSVDLPILIVS